MRIAVDLTPIFDHLTGIERYNINIIESMMKLHPEDNFILLFKGEVHPKFRQLVESDNVSYTILKPCNKLIFMQYHLLRAMNRIAADYYLFLSFTSPFLFKKKKTISAIHDLTCWDCPESIPTKMKYYYRLAYRTAVKHNWKIITVSEFSQKQICQKFDLEQSDVPVIYDGLSDVFQNKSDQHQEYISNKYKIPEKYLLSLSTIEPRKNLQLLIRAYQEMNDKDVPDLVLAGRKGWKLDEIMSRIDEKTLTRIHFTDFVDDADLPGLYANAELFIFPSKYEGFGLPLIEAMSQGTLVLSSDAASLPEVVGSSGILFKSEDKEDLKRKILYCLSLSQTEKQKITGGAIENAKRFNWNTEAEKLHEIMREGKNYSDGQKH